MSQVRSVWLVALALLCLPSVIEAQNGPDRRIRELQVLDQFAGTWTGTQPGTKRKVQVESEWILGGRVLQTKLNLTDGREMLILRTYDPGLKKYVASVWDSQGMAVILSGDWDPQEKTLSVTADAGNLQVRADWQLEDDDTEQWQIVFANAGGRQQRKTAGTNRREQP
jgi:hypothetical protein